MKDKKTKRRKETEIVDESENDRMRVRKTQRDRQKGRQTGKTKKDRQTDNVEGYYYIIFTATLEGSWKH